MTSLKRTAAFAGIPILLICCSNQEKIQELETRIDSLNTVIGSYTNTCTRENDSIAYLKTCIELRFQRSKQLDDSTERCKNENPAAFIYVLELDPQPMEILKNYKKAYDDGKLMYTLFKDGLLLTYGQAFPAVVDTVRNRIARYDRAKETCLAEIDSLQRNIGLIQKLVKNNQILLDTLTGQKNSAEHQLEDYK